MDQPWNAILNDLSCINGRCVALGKIHTKNGWQFTTETSKFYASYLALVYIATHVFHLKHCLIGTLAHGVQKLPALNREAIGSFVAAWLPDNLNEIQYYTFNDNREV